MGQAVGRLPLSGVVEREDAVRHGDDLALDSGDALRQLHFLGPELRPPPLLPVVDHLAGQLEFPARSGIETAQVAPDHLALVEHRGLQLRVGPGARHALAQRLQRPALQHVAANGLRPDQKTGQHHEGEAEQELTLEGHAGKLRRSCLPTSGRACSGSDLSGPPRCRGDARFGRRTAAGVRRRR